MVLVLVLVRLVTTPSPQVVAVVGLLGSAAEREGKKVIVSRRIPE